MNTCPFCNAALLLESVPPRYVCGTHITDRQPGAAACRMTVSRLPDLIAIRDTITRWYPTALCVQLSYGQNRFRVQILHADGHMGREVSVVWDDLLQADSIEERLKEILTKAGKR